MSALVLLGPSLIREQFPDWSLPTDPNDADDLYATSTQFYPASRRGENRQMEQAEIEKQNHLSHQDMYEVSGPPEPPSTVNSGIFSSPSAESYTQSKVQNNYATSFLLEQMANTTLSPVVTQGQNATTQEVSGQRGRKDEMKRERDRTRKQAERYNNKRDYAKICKLLEIPVKPDNTLAHRSEFCFSSTSEVLSIFIVLVVVEGLVEQHKVDSDLRNQLKKTEAYARFLKSKLTNLPTGDDISSSLPCDTHTALDNSNTGASPNGENWTRAS